MQEAVAEAARQRAQALFVPIDTLFYETRAEIMRAALKHALPTMAQRRTVLEDGAFVTVDERTMLAGINEAAKGLFSRMGRTVEPNSLGRPARPR